MCARYTVFTEEEVIEIRSIIDEVNRKFGDRALTMGKSLPREILSGKAISGKALPGKALSEKTLLGEVRPTDIAPILRLEGGRLAPAPARWGFPRQPGQSNAVVINARSETALEKRLFSQPLLTKRVVVPATGFFEWVAMPASDGQLSFFLDSEDGKPAEKGKQKKTKLLFRPKGEKMLYMAGMRNTFIGSDEKPADAFVILTTRANDSMSPFHDRMPVILSAAECEEWLRNDDFMRQVLARSGPVLDWKKAV